MINCLSQIVDRRSKELVIKRPTSGAYDEDGRWQETTPETMMVKGSVQPLRPEEISRLGDSRHIIEAIKIYTTSDVRNLSLEKRTQPDVVLYRGFEFEVYSVTEWASHSKILAIRAE